MNDTRPTPRTSPSPRTTVVLVARREITTRLRDKAFLASLAFMLAVLIASLTISGILVARASSSHVVVATVGPQSTSSASAAGLETHQVPDKAAGVALLSAKGPDKVNAVVEVDAAASPAGTGSTSGAGVTAPSAVSLTALTSVPDTIVKAFSAQPHIALLDPPKADNGAMIGIGIGFSVVFFFVSLTFGMSIAQSVVEEKGTRIVEILVAAIPVRALLAGKVLGNCVLALGQVALLVVLALVGTNIVSSSGAATSLLTASIGWFLAFFLLGFGILACLWAVTGAIATRSEDLGSTTLPMQVILMVPFLASTYTQSPNTMLRVLSYIPFTSPFAMPRRIVMRDVGWEQPTLSLVLLAAGIVATIAVSSRIYSGALLQTTGKAKLRKAWAASAA
jgi:ABC-2 type transport system permease protein